MPTACTLITQMPFVDAKKAKKAKDSKKSKKEKGIDGFVTGAVAKPHRTNFRITVPCDCADLI